MVVGIANGEPAPWMLAHEALSRLAKERAQAEFEEGTWMLAALHSAAHVHLGFASFAQYIERLFGYSPRSTQEKLRVAEALEVLPKMSEALAAGVANWSTARELTRVATPETEEQWLAAARGRTVHQVEALVAGKGPRDTPNSPSRPELRRHVLRFEVSPETLATFREAMAKLRRASDFRLDDDSALLLMARQLLGGPTDEARASYQVALTICEQCGRGSQQAAGELVEVGADVVEMAHCDAQHIGQVHATEEDDAHTGARATRAKRDTRKVRATQTIPPAVRRQVMRRDGGRCVVPGCRHTHFVDLHHLQLRSEGGDHDPDGLVVLCAAHHRAQHAGRLGIEGRVSTGLVFRHADGSQYGQAAAPALIETRSKVFAALRRMGFGEGETRRALLTVGRRPATQPGDAATMLREALAVLSMPRDG